jgi:tetratricopeptide (TPR) repeat protein
MGDVLSTYSRYTDAVRYYHAALELRPGNAELHEDLGLALINDRRTDEALAEYRRAVELSPVSRSARPNLVRALARAGRWVEAAAECRSALAADPTSNLPLHHLAHFLHPQHRDEEVIGLYRKAIEINPSDGDAYADLGGALVGTGQHEEAVKAYRKAVELMPSFVPWRRILARELTIVGRPAEAIVELQTAITLVPSDPSNHFELGRMLRSQSRPEEAAAAFRKARDLNPQLMGSWDGLAAALLDQGHFAEARAATQRLLDLPAPEPKRPAQRRQLELCDALLPVADDLPTILAGKALPAEVAAQRALAEWCLKYRRLPATALGFYLSAFRAQPSLADDLEAGNRFDAACAAALVCCGVARDAGPLDDQRRLVLRQQTLDWLTTEYDAWAQRHGQGKPGDRTVAAGAMRSWLQNGDLTGLRDEQSLARLPAEEQRTWQAFWGKVTALAARDPAELFSRARDHIARQEWKAAAECYAQGLELEEPSDGGEVWFELAAVQLLSGDRPGYRRTCALMLDRGQKTPRLRSYLVARACTLAPDSSDDPERAAQQFRGEFGAATTILSLNESFTEQGALEIRAGRLHRAVFPLEENLRVDGRPGRAVLNWLWLALAYQKLGKAEEARWWLDKATGWLDQQEGRMPVNTNFLGMHRHNWLEAHVLRQEVETLPR